MAQVFFFTIQKNNIIHDESRASYPMLTILDYYQLLS